MARMAQALSTVRGPTELPEEREGKNEGIDVYVEEAPQNRGVSVLARFGYVDTTTSPDLERPASGFAPGRSAPRGGGPGARRVHLERRMGHLHQASIREIREHGGDLKLAGHGARRARSLDLLEFENILQSYSDAIWPWPPSGRSCRRTREAPAAAAAARQPVSTTLARSRSETILSDEDLVREIARKHPDYGLMRIQKELAVRSSAAAR